MGAAGAREEGKRKNVGAARPLGPRRRERGIPGDGRKSKIEEEGSQCREEGGSRSQEEADGRCSRAGSGRLVKSRKERQQFPVAMSPLLLRQREKVRSSSPVGEKTGLDPAAAAPEKHLRPQNVEEDEIGPFLDVVVRRKLSSTCQLVKRKRSENMTSGRACGVT